MPVANIRGLNIVYEIIGDTGPFIALTTGGRRGHGEFIPLARKIAAGGYRVLLHDRRNTGASDILIEGAESEEEIWADDLYLLLRSLDALPAFIGGSSSGSRMSILFYLRHPEAVRALLLLRVTGGPFAAKRLPENYYATFIRSAQQGGMAAVCATEQYQERIAANPANRERLMNLDPAKYIAVMSHWHQLFLNGADLPVMGDTVKGYGSLGWFGLVAPAGTPPAIVDRLNREINTAMGLEDVRQTMQKLGMTPAMISPQAFGEIMTNDYNKFGKLVHDIGFERQ